MGNSSSPDIVGIGAINIDYIVPSGTNYVRSTVAPRREQDSFETERESCVAPKELDDQIQDIGRNAIHPSFGGSAYLAIGALAAMKLGITLGFVGVKGEKPRPGANPDGQWWDNVDKKFLKRLERESPGICLSFNEQGRSERSFLTSPFANQKLSRHIKQNYRAIRHYLSHSKIVHVTSLLDDSTAPLLARLLFDVKSDNPGIIISFDPGHCWIREMSTRTESSRTSSRDGITKILKITDLLFLNKDEFRKLANPQSNGKTAAADDSNAAKILDYCNSDTKIFRMDSTCSAAMYLRRGDVPDAWPVFEARSVTSVNDATGAGDTFAAAVLAGAILPQLSFHSGMKMGLRLAQHHTAGTGTNNFSSFAEEAAKFLSSLAPARNERGAKPCLFIGHGRKDYWELIKNHLINEFGQSWTIESFEDNSVPGGTTSGTLDSMLARAELAVLVLAREDFVCTPEDDMAKATGTVGPSGEWRARQNVVHELGWLQSRLGRHRALMVVEKGVSPPTNLDGVTNIQFTAADDTFLSKLANEIRKMMI